MERSTRSIVAQRPARSGHTNRRRARMAAGIVRALALPIAAALLLATGSARAAYPDEPIKIIVPFGAGDAIDGTARVIADRMKTDLGVPVIIQNIPAAGGAVGTAEAKRAKPADGLHRRAHRPSDHRRLRLPDG